MSHYHHHYEAEEVKHHPRDERRVQDVDFSPKRRAHEKPAEKRVRAFSAREEELLTLIDCHIRRIGAEREQSEAVKA
jgi:hypothetical protein